MKTPVFFFSTLLVLTGLAPVMAQDTGNTSTQQLIEQLGDSNYQVRKSAERQLLKRGEKALAPLRRSAKDDEDPEVQWRAGRLVRRIEDRVAGKTPRKLGKLGKRAGSRDEGVIRETDRRGDEGTDPSRVIDRVMKDLDKAFEGRGFGGDAQREIARAMEQIRKSLREDLRDPVTGVAPRGSKIRRSDSRSMKMSQGPDGVRVEITEKGADGNEKKRVYEAEDMQTFKSKYPGVLKDQGIRLDVGEMFGEDFPFRLHRRLLTPRLERGGDRLRLELDGGTRAGKGGKKALHKKSGGRGTDVVESDRKRLGFYVGEISPAVRDYLNLKGGLMVDSVADGSIASKIGMRKGDIVTRVGEKKIQDIDDVAEALETIGGAEVVVTVIRRGREIELH